MTSGYGDKEREFLGALEAETGRTLAQWMDAIGAAGLSERNDIIDWLRGQGFRFSRASWLERVHHNGGKPIYADRTAGDRPALRRGAVRAPDSKPAKSATTTARALGPGVGLSGPGLRVSSPKDNGTDTLRPAGEAYAQAAEATGPVAAFQALSGPLLEVMAKAKAYRPLAEFLVREIGKEVPGTRFAVRGAVVAMSLATREYATLAVSARELKLTLSSGGPLALTDARQIDGALLARIRQAAQV